LIACADVRLPARSKRGVRAVCSVDRSILAQIESASWISPLASLDFSEARVRSACAASRSSRMHAVNSACPFQGAQIALAKALGL
jgi:hypothetical protein